MTSENRYRNSYKVSSKRFVSEACLLPCLPAQQDVVSRHLFLV